MPLLLPGVLYFATESLTWTGGRAFYDPLCGGDIAVHAHLLTTAQFADIAAQEMYRAPGVDLDLTEVLAHGRTTLGPGRYETLVCAGTYDDYPVLTFTAPWRYRDVRGNPPAPAYLRYLAAGISDAHGWTTKTTASYLATRPGAHLHWTPDSVRALLTPRKPSSRTESRMAAGRPHAPRSAVGRSRTGSTSCHRRRNGARHPPLVVVGKVDGQHRNPYRIDHDGDDKPVASGCWKARHSTAAFCLTARSARVHDNDRRPMARARGGFQH